MKPIDQILNQRKTKKIKYSTSSLNGDAASYTFVESYNDQIMSMNFGNGNATALATAAAAAAALTSTTTNTSSSSSNMNNRMLNNGSINVVQPQIINYTNQTYVNVINNITTASAAASNDMTKQQNYANSYYQWPNYDIQQSSSNDLYSLSQQHQSAAAAAATALMPASSVSNDYQQHNNNKAYQSQSQITSNIMSTTTTTATATTGIEDSFNDLSIRDIIKSIHKQYQEHLNPSVLIKHSNLNLNSRKDFLLNSSSNNKSFNAITNTYTTPHNQNNGNDLVANTYYINLNEILEYFKFYASSLVRFLDGISGKKIEDFFVLIIFLLNSEIMT
jgi:hypothetical protein